MQGSRVPPRVFNMYFSVKIVIIILGIINHLSYCGHGGRDDDLRGVLVGRRLPFWNQGHDPRLMKISRRLLLLAVHGALQSPNFRVLQPAGPAASLSLSVCVCGLRVRWLVSFEDTRDQKYPKKTSPTRRCCCRRWLVTGSQSDSRCCVALGSMFNVPGGPNVEASNKPLASKTLAMRLDEAAKFCRFSWGCHVCVGKGWEAATPSSLLKRPPQDSVGAGHGQLPRITWARCSAFYI